MDMVMECQIKNIKKYWYIPTTIIFISLAAFAGMNLFSNEPVSHFESKDALLEAIDKLNCENSSFLRSREAAFLFRKKMTFPYSDGDYVSNVVFESCQEPIPKKILESLHMFDMAAILAIDRIEIDLKYIHLDHMEFLQYLTLPETKIKNRHILYKLKHLKRLSVRDSDFPFNEIEKLKKALPNTEVDYNEYEYFQWQRKNK